MQVVGGVAGFFGETPIIPKTPIKSPAKKVAKMDDTPKSTAGLLDRSPSTRNRVGQAPIKTPPSVNSTKSKNAGCSQAECLAGLKFVVTGVLEINGREGIEHMVLEYGGKVMLLLDCTLHAFILHLFIFHIQLQLATSVSGKTNYLIAGELLEDGRNVTEGAKYKNAQEKKVGSVYK